MSTVTVTLTSSSLGCFDNSGHFVVQLGAFDLFIGDSSVDGLQRRFSLHSAQIARRHNQWGGPGTRPGAFRPLRQHLTYQRAKHHARPTAWRACAKVGGDGDRINR